MEVNEVDKVNNKVIHKIFGLVSITVIASVKIMKIRPHTKLLFEQKTVFTLTDL